MYRLAITALVAVFVLFSNGWSRASRVAELPNGNAFSCKTCHFTLNGGNRNVFGQMVEKSYLDAGGHVIWNAELAALDADGDGFTNGQELLDPSGSWKKGDANPGQTIDAGNPADTNSKPNITDVIDINASYLSVFTMYPNPAVSYINLSFELLTPSSISVSVYDILGEKVYQTQPQYYFSGLNEIRWDLVSNRGNYLTPGFYTVVAHLSNTGTQIISKSITISR